MSVCEIDWPLVVDFAKTIPGPVATVVAVTIAARFARDTYRKQKVTDLRLDWCRRLYAHLATTAVDIVSAEIATGSKEEIDDVYRHAGVSSEKLVELLQESFLYAGPSGFQSATKLSDMLFEFHEKVVTGKADETAFNTITSAIAATTADIANEMRGELGIPKLAPGHASAQQER